MNKSYDYNNKPSDNFWQPNNRPSYNNSAVQNLSSQQFSMSSGPPPPSSSMFSQSQYSRSQQVQSRTDEGTNASSVYSNYGYDQIINEDVSNRNVSYSLPRPSHSQDHHSSWGSSNIMSRETIGLNRTRHSAFPPPNRVVPSNYNHPDTDTSDSGESCSTVPNWSYGLSKTDGLNRKPACNELNSYTKLNIDIHEPVLNSYGSSNQYVHLGQSDNENSSRSLSNFRENDRSTTFNTPDTYELNFKSNLPSNSEFLNSHKNQLHYRPEKDFPSTSITNYEEVYDEVEADAENDSNSESRTSNVNNTHYNSPLDALEPTCGSNNESSSYHCPTQDLDSLVPDNRRPPPIEVDPNLPQEITAQFKTSSCDLCGVKLNSRLQAKMHYEGRPHSKKTRQAVNEMENKANLSSTSDADSLPSKKKKTVVDVNQLYCKCCDLSLTSTNHATQHYMGRNHHRVLHGLKPLQSGYYNKETRQWQRTPPDPVTSTEQLGLDDKDDLIADSLKHKGKFFCDLCGVATTSKDQLDGHLVGQKHTKKLKALKQAELAEVSAAEEGTEGSILESVIKGDESKKTKPNDLSIFRTPSGKYYCSICDLTLNSELQFAQHVESRKHKLKKK